MNLQERIEQYLNKNLDESVTFESSKNVLNENYSIVKNGREFYWDPGSERIFYKSSVGAYPITRKGSINNKFLRELFDEIKNSSGEQEDIEKIIAKYRKMSK